MTPQEFIAKWRAVELKERSASQSHFNDICLLLDVVDPITADPRGEFFTFEKGASKSSGGEGWADVWRKECFGWEYKGKRKDLDAALAQLQQYALALDNPPLLIVSDMDQIRIHTNWTNTVHKTYTIKLDDLTDATHRDTLRHAFTDPERLKPEKTRQLLTEEAAEQFAKIAQRLRDRKHNAEEVAHFVNRLVFCMFAEDVNLLPGKMFERMLQHCEQKPADFEQHAAMLFGAMKQGGMVGFEKVDWFNGGLFDSDHAFPLLKPDIEDLLKAAKLDWSDVDPSILGTLFERGLDPDKRSQLGAHYTDREKIMMIVNPVIVEPLLAEWAEVKGKIVELLENAPKATKEKLLKGAELNARTKAKAAAEKLHQTFLEKLKAFRVLDPACGSGNFLYLSLLELKNIEHRVNLEAEALGLPRGFPSIGPEAVLGIELNAYAAELARVSVWIGEIQWMRRNGFEAARNPILPTLSTIENRDAVLNADGTRAGWPKADVVVGNPPFIASRDMISELTLKSTELLRSVYSDHLRPTSDFVSYWFIQAIDHAKEHGSLIGLVATDSLPRGDSRIALDWVVENFNIFHAVRSILWNDVNTKTARKKSKSAQVRVCIVCFGPKEIEPRLDGSIVKKIESDLSAVFDSGFVRRLIVQLKENSNTANQGIIPRANLNEKDRKKLDLPKASFLLEAREAQEIVALPTNPNGQNNGAVIRPFIVGDDLILGRGSRYIIDFTGLVESDAALFEKPYERLLPVKLHREKMNQPEAVETWWLPWNNRTALRKYIDSNAYIATPRNGKKRLFVRVAARVVPDCEIVAFSRSDDVTLGILSSKFHEYWAMNTCSFFGVGNTPRYSHKSTFETFPFPEGLTPNIPAADYAADPRAIKIAAAAARLNELRENWLNPADLVKRVPEVVAGYPDRILPVNEAASLILKTRTLTKLYNERPAWLSNAHKALDEVVAEAYGWGDDWRAGPLTEDEVLSRLFKLNQGRSLNLSDGN